MRPQLLDLLILFIALGCTPKADDSGGTGGFQDTNDTGGSGSNPATLPDLDTSDPGGCEEVLDTAVPGAASLFVGEYHSAGDLRWTGEERWLIFANQAWRDVGGADCEVVWITEAEEVAAPACTDCDIGLQTTLTLNEGATTCDLGLVGADDGTASYGVARDQGGVATWYFAASKEFIGAGHHVDGAMSFLTDSSCRWW